MALAPYVTTLRQFEEEVTTFRLGNAGGMFPIYSPIGASMYGGRWNHKGQAVIYTCEHYSTALLETLAYANGIMPPNQYAVEVTMPVGMSYEIVTKDSLPGWHNRNKRVSKQYGGDWYEACRSALLIVPSVVARADRNFVINTAHPDAAKIKIGLEEPVIWDSRLFT